MLAPTLPFISIPYDYITITQCYYYLPAHALFELQKNEPKSLKCLSRAQNRGIIPLTQVDD
jgi:hypothetical protein